VRPSVRFRDHLRNEQYGGEGRPTRETGDRSSYTNGEKVVRGSRHGRQERRAVAYRGGVVAALDRPGRNGNAFKGVAHQSRSARGMPGGQCCLTGGPASASAPLTSGPA
jgi:hypothetical protein